LRASASQIVSLLDDLNQFLEARLDEFLRANPHLELQAMEEQLREQAADTRRLIAELEGQQQQLQASILQLAQDIKLWHQRIAKAEAAGRSDLAQAARDREASLLREGNQRWGQLDGAKQRLAQAQELLAQIEQRRQEVQAKAKAARAGQPPPSSSTGNAWSTSSSSGANWSGYRAGADPLEDQFRRWEMDAEIAAMKREMGQE